MYVIGMGAAIYTGEYDISVIMVKAGLGAAGLLIIVLSTVTPHSWTLILPVYPACPSHTGLRKMAAVAVTIAGTAAAWYTPWIILRIPLSDWICVCPYDAIQIADYLSSGRT